MAEGGEKNLVGRRRGSIVAGNRFSFLGKEKKRGGFLRDVEKRISRRD